MTKPGQREVKELAQDHTGKKQYTWRVNPGHLALEPADLNYRSSRRYTIWNSPGKKAPEEEKVRTETKKVQKIQNIGDKTKAHYPGEHNGKQHRHGPGCTVDRGCRLDKQRPRVSWFHPPFKMRIVTTQRRQARVNGRQSPSYASSGTETQR